MKILPYSRMLTAMVLAILCTGSAWAAFTGARDDFRDESIYFVMTTRFYDGDPSNNVQCWDAQAQNAGDPCWRGDFKGLIEKLDYIKALGFTAVWVTPIVENASGLDYHGYHARNFSKVDHRYESGDTTFQTLIDEAHARGMKIILDVVLNHTGNFGEEYLCKEFTRDWTANQFDINSCMIPYTQSLGGTLPDNYASMAASAQYATRLALMKNTDNVNHDSHNLWHHFGQFNWDDNTRWWAQIAGDCVDLNTENPRVSNYLIDCYGTFIKMGVDGFRIDTGGHISRLTFNKVFIPAFQALGEQYKSKRLNGCPFFMYTEVCARYQGSVTYRNQPALSPYFYTWAENKQYDWNYDSTYWDGVTVMESTDLSTLDNIKSCQQMYADNSTESSSSMPTSNNAVLNGNTYHTPDVSLASGLNVIDFPVHYSFHNIASVWNLALNGDKYYNDASYNVVYVDSHDYCPGPNDATRFNEGTAQWAENLDLMFTFRGIPCLYYGSEIEFRAGQTIDPGGNGSLFNSGRAYYGGYIKGDIATTDFGQYSSASGNVAATMTQPLVRHLQRLNRIRQAVPALRKGQYSTSGCTSTGGYAFKRRYTNGTTDSYVLVTINGPATFTGVLNGTYTDCVTGDTQTVTNGTLTTTSCSGQGNMRVYVLNGPGKIGSDGPYLYASSADSGTSLSYDGTQEELSSNDGTGGGSSTIDLEPYTPVCGQSDRSVFLQTPTSVTAVTVWVWDSSNNYTGGSWPGQSMALMGCTDDQTAKIWKWVYTGELSTMPANIIFVMNGTQTADLTYYNHGYYIESTWDHEVTNYDGSVSYPVVTIDKAAGSYDNRVTVTMTASESDAVIVYTTDGTTPTASSASAVGSKSLTFTQTTTLKAGVLVDGVVRNLVTRLYTITSGDGIYTPVLENADEMSVFFETDKSSAKVWIWDSSNNYTGGSWPGQSMTLMGKNSVGRNIFKWIYTGSLTTMPTGLIFSVNGSPQTADLTFRNHGYYVDGTSSSAITGVWQYEVTDLAATDINGDGAWSMSDVTTLIAYLLGNEPSPCNEAACDINGDGTVSMSDVTTLISNLLGS